MVKKGSLKVEPAKSRVAQARPRSDVRKQGAAASLQAPRFTQMARLSTTHSKFNTLHLNKRRSTRPIKPKDKKSVRVASEDRAVAVEKERQRGVELTEKRRLLSKLLSRQLSAGKTEAAAQTQEQIKDLIEA